MDLVLLNGMHRTTGAGYLSGNRQGCLRGTRKDVLWQIECWLADETDQRVFWLNGLAGTGKSTIAQTFAETSFADGKLGASFFCSRDFEARRDIQNIFPTLAFQLAYRYPDFRKKLLPVLRANPDIGQESLCSQLEKLIIGPFETTCISSLIIIDALDECKDEEPASAILSILSRYVDKIPQVKFFITGRPEPRIRTGFRLELLRPITEVLKLHDVERSSVEADIKLFLEIRLAEIARSRSDCDFTESWPSTYDIDILCKKSAALFIYASTVTKFIASPYGLPSERLTLIISLPQSTTHEGKSGIDLLYTQVLEQAFHDADSDAQELYSRFRLVVGAVLLVFNPLSRKTLSELLKKCNKPSRISNALRSLHSLLLVPDNGDDPISPFHKSFPDFLTDPTRCKDERFFIDPPVHHINILFSCLELMKERLRKNICDLKDYPSALSDSEDLPDRKKTRIGDALEYACRFWTKHLSEIRSSGPHVERVKAAIEEFFTIHLLFWIEVLSLTGHLNLGVYALHDIDRWYLSVSCVRHLAKHTLMSVQTGDSCEWTNDSQRLILSSFDGIHDTPADVYRHALPFCPSSSWLHKWYTSETLQEVKVVKGRPDKWGTYARAVSFGCSLKAFVSWRGTIAVGLLSGDIIILDETTGSSRSVLSGHVKSVVSLAFSMDGTLLVSGGSDGTIKLWDIQTGGVVKKFHATVSSVAISPDAITIASASYRRISLWDVRAGECHHIIDVTTTRGGVTYLEFLSTVPGRLVAVCGGLIQQWDIAGSKAGLTIPGHHIAFSSDGNRFVSCDKGPPTVRDTVSGTVIATLHSPGQDFSQCCFSPSDEIVAGVADGTLYFWTITGTPHLIKTFVPEDSKILSIVYSSSLTSMHYDGKIRFGRIDSGSPDLTTGNTKRTGSPQSKIIYVTLWADEGFAISVDANGTIERWDLSTGLRGILLRIPEILIVGGVRLVDGILTIIYGRHPHGSDPSLPLLDTIPEGDESWDISTWDVKAERMLQRIPLLGELHPGPGHGLGMSKDGTTFFMVAPQEIRTWSVLTGEITGTVTYRECTYGQTDLFFGLNGPITWIYAPRRSRARGWDRRTLELPLLDPSTLPNRLRPAYIQDLGDTGDGPHYGRIIDMNSRKVVFRIPRHLVPFDKVVSDGRYLVAVYGTGELLILDFVHRVRYAPFSGVHPPTHQGNLESDCI